MQEEIWKDIEGYEGLYQVSNIGRVKSVERWVYSGKGNTTKRLNPESIKAQAINQGYPVVTIWKNNKIKMMKIHRLVCQAFVLNPDNKSCVNHIDEIKTHNYVENLEWCTHSENHKHAYKNGLMVGYFQGKFGKDNVKSMPVLQIDQESGVVIGEYSAIMDAHRDTGISQSNISSVCNGKRRIAGGFKWKFKINL